MADADKLRQVIGNLLTNAHLYTPAGGRIEIGASADRAWVRIVVADSGVGMTGEEAARVFDRFYRAPGRSGVPGTGLGLAIVKSLVDLQGGEIEVVSRPGQAPGSRSGSRQRRRSPTPPPRRWAVVGC